MMILVSVFILVGGVPCGKSQRYAQHVCGCPTRTEGNDKKLEGKGEWSPALWKILITSEHWWVPVVFQNNLCHSDLSQSMHNSSTTMNSSINSIQVLRFWGPPLPFWVALLHTYLMTYTPATFKTIYCDFFPFYQFIYFLKTLFSYFTYQFQVPFSPLLPLPLLHSPNIPSSVSQRG